jgi:threonine dehydrogenase-like Zn-dependent dehydrogenase
VPPELSDEEAVLLEPASNGVRAALRARPARGEKALVIGAGTIGLMTVQALRAAEPGLDITAAVLFDRQAEQAVARGADRAIVREDLFAAAARLTGARVYTGLGRNRAATGGFDFDFPKTGIRMLVIPFFQSSIHLTGHFHKRGLTLSTRFRS